MPQEETQLSYEPITGSSFPKDSLFRCQQDSAQFKAQPKEDQAVMQEREEVERKLSNVTADPISLREFV
jgi:hypothetical protein